MNKYLEVETVGDLKKILENYPDDTMLVTEYGNAPLNVIEIKFNEEIFLNFTD